MSIEEVGDCQEKLARLEELQTIFRYWFRLREKTWPSECSGKDVGGQLLDLLDSDVAGSVSTFLGHGFLTQVQLEALIYCDEALPAVINELDGFPYCWLSQLKKLTSSILNYKNRWGIPIHSGST